MLKMPSSVQTCSSSPIRSRLGSAESVVLPVPDRPKSSDERPGFAVGRRRAVHRKQAALRPEVVHHREDALLHLAGILGAQDDQLARPPGSRLMLVLESTPAVRRLAGKAPALQMTKSGLPNAASSCLRGPDEHGVHEEGVIGP